MHVKRVPKLGIDLFKTRSAKSQNMLNQILISIAHKHPKCFTNKTTNMLFIL